MTDEELPIVTIYTDGGASPNPGFGGWGAILIFEAKSGRKIEKEISGSAPNSTNNRMELTSALEALKALKKPCQIDFYTDSQYLKQGIDEWMAGWRKSNFKRGKIKNVDLWLELNSQTMLHQITWHWVKGHAGNKYNERVDQLATMALETLSIAAMDEVTSPASVNRAYLRVSCLGSPGAGAWAVLIELDGKKDVLSGHYPSTNPARLDLLAAIAALEAIPIDYPLQVFTANSYLRDGITTWVKGWKQNGWIKKTGGEVVYRDLWEKLEYLTQNRIVYWVLVKEVRPEPMILLEPFLQKEIENITKG